MSNLLDLVMILWQKGDIYVQLHILRKQNKRYDYPNTIISILSELNIWDWESIHIQIPRLGKGIFE